MKATLRLLGLFILILLTACDPSRKAVGTSKDDGIIEIVFLQLNDVYEIAPLGDNTGGLARVASLRKSLLAKNPNTFTVLAGDFISPSVMGTLKYNGKRIRGKQMVETLNALGLDLVVFGNHEFDYDLEDLQDRMDESKFIWLAGNARQKSGDHIHAFAKNTARGDDPCPDYMVYEVRDADGTTVDLGIFGVLITSGQKPYVVYSDPLTTAKTSMEVLRPRTDVCVGLTHLDIEDDKTLAGMLPDVPLIMGGHDHNNMLHKVGKSVVAKADANARTVYVHTLRFDKKNGTSTVKSVLRKIDESIPNEPSTYSVVSKWENIQNEVLKESGIDPHKKIIDLKEPLDCREAIVRHESAPVGGLITKAMLAASKNGSVCAIVNSGSIRVDDVLTGSITELDIVRMLPFGGGLTEVEMKGSLLRRTLEAGVGNKGKGGWLQLGNISWDAGSNHWQINGQALQEAGVYKVILPDFLLTGLEANMDFLKTEFNEDRSGTTNPDILRMSKPASGDQTDLRRDIRIALINYLVTKRK